MGKENKIKKTKFFLDSVGYILVSGASKGFNYLLLLYLAAGAFSKEYVTILLLLSLEQILTIILPLNNPYIIYSKNIVTYEDITNKLITNSLMVVGLYVFIFLIFRNSIYEYFETDYLIVFASILINITVNSYAVYLSNYYKVIERHKTAFLVQALLLISFISIVVTMFFIENKVLAFFLGKAIGFIIILILFRLLKLNFVKYKFLTLNLTELKYFFNLLSVSILGWVSGLGFMNIAKIYSTDLELVKIGYVLNLLNVFLLLSIGVNSVYNPLIKKNIIQGDSEKTIKIKNNTLYIYLVIVLLSFTAYFALNSIFSANSYPRINEIISVLPYAILIFLFSVFQSVAHPFYLTYNKFRTFNVINILSYLFWVFIIVSLSFFGFKEYIWFLVIIYFLKASIAYIYARMSFMNTHYLKQNKETLQ